MPDLEPYALYFMGAGAVLLLIGLIWLLIVAFKTGFIKKAFVPVLVVLLGMATALFVPVMTKAFPKPVQTTAQVFGDTITITGAKKSELEVVMGHKGWKGIQAENLGLTDEQVAGLVDMTELESIKLDDNPVTDVTLERLVKLPKLTKIHIARTKITPDGIKKHIFDNPETKVTEIDISELNVPGKVVREWENAKKGHRVSQ